MLQDDPLLAQFKQQLHSQTPRAEGVVRAAEKGSGFLKVDARKSCSIPPPQMKRVTHGDRIAAIIHTEKDRESAEPEELIESFLTRFAGRAQGKNDRLSVMSDHPLLRDAIPCRAARGVEHEFKEGDWAVAEVRRHPLKGDHTFYAELTQFIAFADDHFVLWWVTLARHNLEEEAPNGVTAEMLDEGLVREDLAALNFVTIDSASTEDMDDALYTEEQADGTPQLTVAIVDPTAWIAESGKLDKMAEIRAFTNCLPGFNILMLPCELSDDLRSLRANEVRPVLACRMSTTADGTIEDNITSLAAIIESKAKLAYDNVSDWLEGTGEWQPENDAITEQIRLLHRICLSRGEWRHNHTLVFKDRLDYRFVLGEKGGVLDIVAKPRRIANRIVKESMIAANICAARVLRDKLSFGTYNVHMGFDLVNVDALAALLRTHGMYVDAEEVLTPEGPCKLCRELDAQPSGFLDSRIRRFQSYAEISIEPGSHFGLGLEAYAAWTSLTRKYGDMINHCLFKAVIKGETVARPQDDTTVQMAEHRRLNQMAERDMGDWLYAHFLSDKAGADTRFAAEIIDVSRGGMRVRLVDNDAVVFIPAPFLRAVCDGLVCSQESGTVQIKGEVVYKVTDMIDVTIAEVRMKTHSVIVRPAT